MTERIDLTGILDALGPDFESRAAEHDADDSFVSENWAALRGRRVFSALVPAELGGGGATHGEMCAFLRGLARRCPSTALALSMHQHLVAAAAANHQAGRPGKALLEKVAGGELALVSTGANDWLDSNGSAERVGGGWRVTAVKPFASGGPEGDVMVTSAAWDDAPEGAQVLHFPVPLSADGVERRDDWRALGMRGTGSGTIRLNGVFVPEEAVVLKRPRGPFHPAFAVIVTVALPLIMSAYLGVAEKAADIARERAAGRPEDPATQILAGELDTLLASARHAVDAMIRRADGYDFAPDAALAAEALTSKTLAANAVMAAAEKALELAGGAGFFRKTGIERLLRDVHGAQFHPLPEKRQQLFCGRLALGLDPVTGAATEAPRAAA